MPVARKLTHVQGVSAPAIARHFGIDYHTAAKALGWFGRR